MARVLTYLLLVVVWIAAGAIQSSFAAGALAIPAQSTSGSVRISDTHDMHGMPGANNGTASHHKGGCDRSQSQDGDDESAACCPSMCQTVGTIEPNISIERVVIPRHFVAFSAKYLVSVLVPTSERPPRIS